MMRRVPEVLDCWFESGSMPFAQVHYPFENKDWFDAPLPRRLHRRVHRPDARLVLHAPCALGGHCSTGRRSRNVICHGVVLDHEGRKLSKKLRNYPDPEDVFESHGSDALRWLLMASPILRGGDLRIATDASRLPRCDPSGPQPDLERLFVLHDVRERRRHHRSAIRTDAEGLLDRYVLAKTAALVEVTTERMDRYDIAGTCAEVPGVPGRAQQLVHKAHHASGSGRRGPTTQRWWPTSSDAYDTLFTVLTTLVQVVAPLLPMVAEEIHLGLCGTGELGDASVHLLDWPDTAELPQDPELVAQMDRIREVCSVALGLREDNRLRARLPLQSLTIAGRDLGGLEELTGLVRDEVNVREVVLTDDLSTVGQFLLRPNAKLLGPRLGKQVQDVLRAAKAGEWHQLDDGTVSVGGANLTDGEFELAVQPAEGRVAAPLRGNDAVVELDVEVTDELRDEGRARDIVRVVQQARKDAGLHVSDRISLTLFADDELTESIAADRDWIDAQVLATESAVVEQTDSGSADDGSAETDGLRFAVAVERRG
ncbi:MAG: DUF5915 domain-containing protein [Microthrixaceae bacterium]